MATLSEVNRIAKENREAINTIISNSKTINQVVNATGITTDDYILIYDNAGNLTGKGTIQQVFDLLNLRDNSILIASTTFNFYKKPGNTLNTMQLGDIIKDGYVNGNVMIHYARYTNKLATGDVNNIGTLAGNYKDGNYENVRYTKLT